MTRYHLFARVSDRGTPNPQKNILFILIRLMAGLIFTGCKKEIPQKNPETAKTWTVTTIAGDGDSSFGNDPVTSAEFHFPNDVAVAKFYTPYGLGIDAQGNIYVADTDNNRVRKISLE